MISARLWISGILLAAVHALVPTAAVSDKQREAWAVVEKLAPCALCGERHPFMCPYIRKATLRGGEFVVIEPRDEFFRDYVCQIPHGPGDIEVDE